MRMFVESWAPEYGTPLEADSARTDENVRLDVEEAGAWQPRDGHDDGVEQVAFVDGVQRVDARLTVETPTGPVTGLCGSVGVGAVVWDRAAVRSTFEQLRVVRLAVQSRGVQAPFPPVGHGLAYETASVDGEDPALLIRHLHERMRSAEAELTALLDESMFVVADGPISELRNRQVVGVIKSHRRFYLDEEHGAVMTSLRAGTRTPMFLVGDAPYARYSWYVRLADDPSGHAWSGVVRCVTPEAIGVEAARRLADRTAALLPRFASEAHTDPRAPQNLVPIGALERELRRSLGDPGLVYRAIREAVALQRESA